MNPFPKCISKNCPVEHSCLRKQDGDSTAEVDYVKVHLDDEKCRWYIEYVAEVDRLDEGTEIEDEEM